MLGQGQNHLAVAGGCAAYGVPTRYREVVLTLSKLGFDSHGAGVACLPVELNAYGACAGGEIVW